MAKGDRRHKREEIRRIVAEDERRRKEKEKKKDRPRKANYRKDRDGNIILWGNVKFSKISVVVLSIIVGIAIFFYIVSTGVGDMEYEKVDYNYCVDVDFNDGMCMLDYKFCHEYADGSTECTFAETDPFTDIDENEKKWTEDEQDFLPPTEYLPFVQYAEARGEDEPTCYSTACKQDNPNLDKDNESDAVKSVVEAKKDVNDIKDEMTRLNDYINEMELEAMTYKNNFWTAEQALDEAEDNYKEEKKKYRHAMDVRVQNEDDIEMQKQAKRDFDDTVNELKDAQREYIQEKNKYEKFKDDLRIAKNDLIYATDELDASLLTLTESKVQSNQKKDGDNKFINIVLSKGCLTLIEYGMPTTCPTYRELRDTWDNTIPSISGEWVDLGYDVKRENPKMEQYWKYYEAQPSWKIITVDPDTEMMQRGVTITIQASNFIYHENIKSVDKTPSYNATGLVQYDWHNVKYYDNCRSVMMAPDIELLPDIIDNLWGNCDKQEPVKTELVFDDWTGENSPFYAYTKWLQDAMERCLTKC